MLKDLLKFLAIACVCVLLLGTAAFAQNDEDADEAPDTVVLFADQARTQCSDSNASSGVYADPTNVPPECPTPADLAISRFDSVSEWIADYTNANGGNNNNSAGEGILGYFNSGQSFSTLNCTTSFPVVTADLVSENISADCNAVIRYNLAGVDLAGIKGAALNVNGYNLSLWNTLAVSLCENDHAPYDFEKYAAWYYLYYYGIDMYPYDPNPNTDPFLGGVADCITTNRDFIGFWSFVQVHDTLVAEAIDNPAAGYAGGTDKISYLDRFLNTTIPLSQDAVDYIKSGGDDAGNVAFIVRHADYRAALSEGPGGAATATGLDFANVFVAEDENGLFLPNNVGASGRTSLILEY